MADDTKKLDLPPLTIERSPAHSRREITDKDLTRINLAKIHWHASADKIQDELARTTIGQYTRHIGDAIRDASGLIIVGAPGVGKSSAAAVVAKEVTRYNFSVHVITHQELQEIVFDDKREFEDGVLLMERLRRADLLILDDFNEDFAEDRRFGALALEKLLERRRRNCLATILTTRIQNPRERLSLSLCGLFNATMVAVRIEGKDLRMGSTPKWATS